MTSQATNSTRKDDLVSPRLRIAPSLLAADFSRLRDELARIESAGADVLHLDVMDGHFVPNISYGPPVIAGIRDHCGLFFDTHLMIEEPGRYAQAFVDAGADGITFHIEVADDAGAIIAELRNLGVKVGVSLNPKTPVESVYDCLSDVDIVNVMTVEPGFGGQSFMRDMLDKVRELKKRMRPEQRLEVDGGLNTRTIADAVRAGADLIVAGTAVFRADDPRAALDELRRLGAEARDGSTAREGAD